MQVARLLALYSRQPVRMDLQNMTTARAIRRRWRATSRTCNRASPLSRSHPSTCSLKPPRSKPWRISDPCSGRQGAAVCNRRLFWERAIWKSPLLGYSARNATTGSSSVAPRGQKTRQDSGKRQNNRGASEQNRIMRRRLIQLRRNQSAQRQRRAAKPTTNPNTTGFIPCASTSRTTSFVCAPSAIRTPISPVRCSTVYATAP